jgi:hypothetical protein
MCTTTARIYNNIPDASGIMKYAANTMWQQILNPAVANERFGGAVPAMPTIYEALAVDGCINPW